MFIKVPPSVFAISIFSQVQVMQILCGFLTSTIWCRIFQIILLSFLMFLNFQMYFGNSVPFSLCNLKSLTQPYHPILKGQSMVPKYCFISFFVVTVALQITFLIRNLFLSWHWFLSLQLQKDLFVSSGLPDPLFRIRPEPNPDFFFKLGPSGKRILFSN